MRSTSGLLSASWWQDHHEALLTAAPLVVMVITGYPTRRVGWQWELILIALAWLPLIVRNRWPVLVLVFVAAVDTISIGVAGHAHPPASVVPVSTMLALYTVSVRFPARRAWSIAAAVGALQFVVAVTTKLALTQDFLYLNWVLVATIGGQLVRERRIKLAAADRRAVEAERGKEAEAARRVIAERMRIARELHDVLAHHIEQARQLLQRVGDERLAAPAWVDRHAQGDLDRAGHLGEQLRRAARVDRHADAGAACVDQAGRVGEVRRRLRVEGDGVRAGADEVRRVALRALDHQMHLEHPARLAHPLRERLDDHRPDRDGRHEVPVHHVHVDHPRAGREHLADLLAQATEVGRQDRRHDLHGADQLACTAHRCGRADPAWGVRHTACSIVSPQLLHFSTALVDILTIVECSPQLGHTELSSKRCRQFTQR